MSSTLIGITTEELARVVEAAVERALAARAPAQDASDWIDTKGAAAILGVSTRQVAILATTRKDRPATLPSSRVGRLLRFRRTDVLAVLERRAD